MNVPSFRRSLVLVMLVGWLIAGCGPSQGPAQAGNVVGPQAWFDAPLPNSSFPLGPVQIVAHGSDPGGIATFEFSVDGAPSALPSPNTSQSLVTLSHTWTPDQPGTYTLGLRSENTAGQWSSSASTTVIIEGVPTGSPTSTATATEAPAATLTPTLTPTPVPPSGPASIELVSVSTNELYFGGGSCGDQEITVQVRAIDPVGITVVVLFYRVKSQSGDETDYLSRAMNPMGGDLYSVTVNPSREFDPSELDRLDNGWFQYQAIIQDKTGDTKTRTIVYSDVTIAPCGGGGSAPPPVRQRPTPVPTNTPIVVK